MSQIKLIIKDTLSGNLEKWTFYLTCFFGIFIFLLGNVTIIKVNGQEVVRTTVTKYFYHINIFYWILILAFFLGKGIYEEHLDGSLHFALSRIKKRRDYLIGKVSGNIISSYLFILINVFGNFLFLYLIKNKFSWRIILGLIYLFPYVLFAILLIYFFSITLFRIGSGFLVFVVYIVISVITSNSFGGFFNISIFPVLQKILPNIWQIQKDAVNLSFSTDFPGINLYSLLNILVYISILIYFSFKFFRKMEF